MAEENARFALRAVKSEDEVEDVEHELSNARGVVAVDIDPESGAADVRYDDDEIGEEQIRGAFQDMGYEVS
ncbi:heavy-metal-associated domain-containing protein [Halopelagius longus]|uniref:Copper chaperone n=1 Tax=Halopelagius longus TaxID=1236180 RepID=A0A1H1EC34_9EURY|nr:heavy-metal-associated domain-containing protein [Halopelagius longus]RDI71675.1 copper chaperone [Halopelagius longus]SDQ85716.1 Copper chaperone CopZ [Halopelagius longus]